MNNHIRRKKLLDSHGGCWITSDPEIESEHLRIRGAIQPDTSDRETLHLLQEKADVSVLTNPMMVRFGQEEEDIRRVQELLKDHGLKAERIRIPGKRLHQRRGKDPPKGREARINENGKRKPLPVCHVSVRSSGPQRACVLISDRCG